MTTTAAHALLPAHAFLPAPLLAAAQAASEAVPGVPGLFAAQGLQADHPVLENAAVLGLVVEVFRAVAPALTEVLTRRRQDRAFLDAGTLVCARDNVGRGIEDADYATVIGQTDAVGRVVVGPLPGTLTPPTVTVPDHLVGAQVTLFGPPDSIKMSINAMNALHRRRPDEPALVAELVAECGDVPRWGADSEDSKTPLARDLLSATENLAGCLAGTLDFTDPRTGKRYQLAETGRSKPIKRIPGLALPDGAHLLDGEPLPMHIVDLVQHVWLNRDRPEARVLYVPKLENEEEAAYLALLLRTVEAAVQARHPSYISDSIRVILVFENPRAIFRIREMAAALSPFFLGGSLGWHDFLASTARLFRHDPNYRIPVKADPDIVIRNIRESHHILVRDLGPSGALKIGGMYGVLFTDGDPASFAVSMVGYIRDVVTQMKRGLDGFWVAHPDFVRIGIALVAAWRRTERSPDDDILQRLVCALVPDPVEQAPLLAFVVGPDVPGLPLDDPRYNRAVLAAERGASPVIRNDDPEEVRYNLFQAVQYLADWLSGNGCVALPATMNNAHGEAIFVRIMDDLATTERSRWEVWAEVAHGRVSVETIDSILAEEVAFLERGVDTGNKRVAVPWGPKTAQWYPLAAKLIRQLVVDPAPPEFVTELLLPFTVPCVRDAKDPWAAAKALCPGKFEG
jgi:malate synthase